MQNGNGSTGRCSINSNESGVSSTGAFIKKLGINPVPWNGTDDDDTIEPIPFNTLQADEYQSYMNKKISYKDYDITFKRKLGEGNFGLVHEGILENRKTGEIRFVALKTLKNDNEAQNRADLERDMERESEIMRQLKHPNIVNIIDCFKDCGQLLIVMELVKNDSLKRYLNFNIYNMTSNILLKFARDIASVSIVFDFVLALNLY